MKQRHYFKPTGKNTPKTGGLTVPKRLRKAKPTSGVKETAGRAQVKN